MWRDEFGCPLDGVLASACSEAFERRRLVSAEEDEAFRPGGFARVCAASG